ncbi:MAG TPA: DinB family protein [Chitinophagaceae bacterium]|nr:DinB family protein [Chitinophagaceae bacterium]HPH32519.1 DinB family protein [Chitinophagaceae bacterium]HPN59085.1 DinB family protein [Chitinophagaceae bacterium]
MKKAVNDIIQRLENTVNGEPWFGRSALSLLKETNPEFVFMKTGNGGHSLADLLWHMITWAQFTLNRLEKKEEDMEVFESLDWRSIDPAIHSWKNGIKEFTSVFGKIVALLKTKEDAYLEEKVDYRDYNVQFLLNGLIEHTIYHLGQIAYAQKQLS